jgi:hypothetical protein
MGSVNHDLANPLAVNVVYAPIRDLSATFRYCCPVTVLEWNAGHVIVLPPVTKLKPFVSRHTQPPQDIERYSKPYSFSWNQVLIQVN